MQRPPTTTERIANEQEHSQRAERAAVMSRSERVAYRRGYQVGAKKWPDHRPPAPPDPIVCELVLALQEIRDMADTFASTLDPDDDWVEALTAWIIRADESLSLLGHWIKDAPLGALDAT